MSCEESNKTAFNHEFPDVLRELAEKHHLCPTCTLKELLKFSTAMGLALALRDKNGGDLDKAQEEFLAAAAKPHVKNLEDIVEELFKNGRSDG